MKKNIIFTLLLSALIGIGYSQAQSNGATKKSDKTENKTAQKLTPEQKSQKNSERLEKKLSLTADQKTKVYGFTLTRIQKTGEIKASENKDKKSKGDAFKSVRDEYDSNINSVLTAEQKTKWVQLKAEAKARKEKNKKEGVKKDTPANETEGDEDLED